MSAALPMAACWRRFARARAGAVAILTAVMMTGLIAAAALALDLGALYYDKRKLQGAVDLAALGAASDLARAEPTALAVLADNGFGAARGVSVITGRYRADASLAAGARFTPAGQPVNAVRVGAHADSPAYLSAMFHGGAFQIAAAATAALGAEAAFSAGSRLLSVDGGLVNALLGALFGSNIALSALDHRALLDARIALLPFLDALAVRADMQALTYDDVLRTSLPVADIVAALAETASQGGDAAAGRALETLAAALGSGDEMALAPLIDAGPLAHAMLGSGADAGLGATVSAMGMVTAVAGAAAGGRQVSLDLGAALPGLVSTRVDLAIGEPAQASPWISVGEHGATVRTAQVRLRLVAETPGNVLLGGVGARLPLYVEVAPGEATLRALSCNGRAVETVSIGARPGVAGLWIGESGALDRPGGGVTPARLAQVLGLMVTGQAHVGIHDMAEHMLVFSRRDIEDGKAKTARTRDLTRSLVSTLLGDLRLSVAGVGLGGGALMATLAGVLQPLGATLDPVLTTLLDVLGVGVGEVDVSVHGARCGHAAIVQ